MKIESLELVGYKRLLLRNIKSIEITPTTIHQIVIGTNGSGKSSLLRELSPLPAQSKDFIKGGSKTIRLSHRLHHFMLKTDFSIGNGKHEFYIDEGENLNPGGTATVQKELVKQYLNYDEQTHRILMGINKFSTMPALLRRDILTDLSGANLDYAFELWQMLKSRFRDQQGVVKHINGRLAQESTKLINIEKMEEMTAEYEDVTTELTFLMSQREPNLPESMEQSVADLLESFNFLAKKVMDANIDSPEWMRKYSVQNVDDIAEVTNSLRVKQSAVDAKLEKYHEEFDELKGIIDALSATNAEGVEELQKNLTALKMEHEELQGQFRQFIDIGSISATEAMVKSEAVYPTVVDILSTLPVNTKRFFSRDNFVAASEKAEIISKRMAEASNRFAKLEHQLSHHANAEKVNCPKCGFIHTPGYENFNKEETLKRSKSLGDFIESEKRMLEDVEKYIEDYQHYQQIFHRWQHLNKTSGFMQPFIDCTFENDAIFESPASLLPVLENWMNDIRVHRNIADVYIKIEMYSSALEKAKSNEGGEAYTVRFKRIQDNISTLTNQSIQIGKQMNEVDQYHKQIRNILSDYGRLIEHAKELKTRVDLWIRCIRKKSIDDAIKDDHKLLGQLSHMLNIGHSVQKVVDDLEESLVTVKNDLEAYKILVDEISPTDGLIAEQVKGFIGTFVDQLNLVISQIWTYELKVLPCGIGDGDLDYKFGIVVNGEEAGNDVRDTDASTGQLEVIDFAFKLIYMLFKGMEDYPLYLDELGPHMDDEHRNNIMRFVHMLVETNKCSQLWLVSHFSAMHEIFNNVEYCVMDEQNVALPHVYNRHVKFG